MHGAAVRTDRNQPKSNANPVAQMIAVIPLPRGPAASRRPSGGQAFARRVTSAASSKER
jgi:hypothetical protein